MAERTEAESDSEEKTSIRERRGQFGKGVLLFLSKIKIYDDSPRIKIHYHSYR